ncbi:hypothetical protein [Nitrosospira sp. NpAV]|uniref:hypothetical protein n=1 Tax=Nitrosospira sp. NpAV TaxID=58133 RepID=UPI0006970026|nr:hypothetical protein [Nitrosospira sp. NpAV]
MPTKNPVTRPTAKSIASYVKKHAPKVEETQGHHHAASETIREADYEGHHIVVRTTYRIEVDGTPVTGHMGVTDDGNVHYHPIPNMSFASALDMVKQLIDVFPDDFTAAKNKPVAHGGHTAKTKLRTKSASSSAPTKKTGKKTHAGHNHKPG